MQDGKVFLFVSHVTEDRAAALQVVDELERRGIGCWIAPRDIVAGQSFDDAIADGIESSRALLLIFSERCNNSEYIRREITVAGNARKAIIPFRIENAEPKKGLAVRLADLHWIDGFVARERAIDEVMRTVKPTPKRETGEEDRSGLKPDGEAVPVEEGKGSSEVEIDGLKTDREKTHREEPRPVYTESNRTTSLMAIGGLLLLQGLVRIGMSIDLLSRFPTDRELPGMSLLWVAFAVAMIAASIAIWRRATWARPFGLVICGIGILMDLFSISMSVRGSTLSLLSYGYLIINVAGLIFLYRSFRPKSGTT